MYYDDKARQFNFASGLIFGAVLGAGIALLWEPQDQVRSLIGRRSSRGRWKKRATRGLRSARGGVADSLAGVSAAGRKYLRR